MRPEVKWINDYLDSKPIVKEMADACCKAFKWSVAKHSYESKNKRICECRGSTNFYEIYCSIMAAVFLAREEGITYQALIGYLSGDIDCADPLDRAKCAAELIALAYQTGLIVITKVSDKTFLITTEFQLSETIPEFDKHIPEFRKPEPVSKNQILGNVFKQHAMETSSDHIDRMNAIPLSLDSRLLESMSEPCTANLTTQEQKDQWTAFIDGSKETYQKVINQGNKFYLNHAFDTRGRTYCRGYYITYQGASYKKAMVQLANKEVVQL